MKYETGVVAIAAPSLQAGRDAILQYGVSDIPYPTDDQVTVIPTILIVSTKEQALDLPPGIQWALVDGADPLMVTVMKAHSGLPQRIADVIRAMNEEYAIHPSKLMRGPA